MTALTTPWYAPGVKPVRVGFYEAPMRDAEYPNGYPRFWWDGDKWLYVTNDRMYECEHQNRHWRGLRRPSGGAK